MESISSRENQKIKDILHLMASRQARRESGRFAFEGLRLAMDALDAGIPIERLFLTEQAMRRHPEACLRLQGVAEASFAVSEALCRKISDTETPQGVFCQCPLPDGRLTLSDKGGYLLLASLQDPGNVGAVIRSANAFGLDVFLSADCPDLFSPKVIRASMGGVFRAAARVIPSMETLIDELRGLGVPVYAAALSAQSVSVLSVPLHRAAVMIGNEGGGIPSELAALCDGSVMIPIRGGCESLNAAVAAGIFAWEMRGRAGFDNA